MRALVARRVDGVVFPGVTEGSTIPGELLERGIPVVIVSSPPRTPASASSISTRRRRWWGSSSTWPRSATSRVAFAPATLREEDRPTPEALRKALEPRARPEARVRDDPTAICCKNDVTALELLDALARRGRRVPEAMSVVGFDYIPLAGHALVGLTTVRQDAERIGVRSAELLLAAIAEGRPRSPPARSAPVAARWCDARPDARRGAAP